MAKKGNDIQEITRPVVKAAIQRIFGKSSGKA
jgi:hypothetical protein